jgi:hypothetical protein
MSMHEVTSYKISQNPAGGWQIREGIPVLHASFIRSLELALLAGETGNTQLGIT